MPITVSEFWKKYKVVLVLGVVLLTILWYQNCRTDYWKEAVTIATTKMETAEEQQKLKDVAYEKRLRLLDEATKKEIALREDLEKERARLLVRGEKLANELEVAKNQVIAMPPSALAREFALRVGEGEVSLLPGNYFRFTLMGAQTLQTKLLDGDYWKTAHGVLSEEKVKILEEKDSLVRENGDLRSGNTTLADKAREYKANFDLCKNNVVALEKLKSKEKFIAFAKGVGTGVVVIVVLKLLSVI